MLISDTPVLTDKGWKLIQKVRRTDLVYTHRGRFAPVLALHSDTIEKILLCTIEVGNYFIVCTPDTYHFVAVTCPPLITDNTAKFVQTTKLYLLDNLTPPGSPQHRYKFPIPTINANRHLKSLPYTENLLDTTARPPTKVSWVRYTGRVFGIIVDEDMSFATRLGCLRTVKVGHE